VDLLQDFGGSIRATFLHWNFILAEIFCTVFLWVLVLRIC